MIQRNRNDDSDANLWGDLVMFITYVLYESIMQRSPQPDPYINLFEISVDFDILLCACRRLAIAVLGHWLSKPTNAHLYNRRELLMHRDMWCDMNCTDDGRPKMNMFIPLCRRFDALRYQPRVRDTRDDGEDSHFDGAIVAVVLAEGVQPGGVYDWIR